MYIDMHMASVPHSQEFSIKRSIHAELHPCQSQKPYTQPNP